MSETFLARSDYFDPFGTAVTNRSIFLAGASYEQVSINSTVVSQYKNDLSADNASDQTRYRPLDMQDVFIRAGYTDSHHCLNIDSSNITNNFEFKQIDTSLQIKDSNSVVTTVREYEGIILSKYYYNFPTLGLRDRKGFVRDPIDVNGNTVKNQFIFEYYQGKVFNYDYYDTTLGVRIYNNLVVAQNAPLIYQEEFTEESGDFPTYTSPEIKNTFFPFMLFENGRPIHGQDLSSLIYGNVSPDICDANPGPQLDFTPDTISCDSRNNGVVIIDYASNGKAIYEQNQQLCPIGGTATTVFSRIKYIYDTDLNLYKDLPIVTAALEVYGYNFRYIKYHANDGTYSSFLDAGSVQSATYKSNEDLDFSKYFSYKYDSTLEDSFLFTYGFKTYKVATTDASAFEYRLDVVPLVKKPTIKFNQNGDSITVQTDYGTRLEYRFNNDSAVSVSISDTADGTGQETVISSTGKTGILIVSVFNYFYDFDGETRPQYMVKDQIQIDNVQLIPSYTFRILRPARVAFFDQNGAISAITLSNFTQNSFGSYYYYSDYANGLPIAFQSIFSLAGTVYSKVSFGVEGRLPKQISSSGTLALTRDQLFALLVNDKLTFNLILDDSLIFTIPFTIKNYSTFSPICSAVSIVKVQVNNKADAKVTFDVDFQYSDRLEYSVIDNSGTILYSSYRIIGYTTTSDQKEITTGSFNVGESTSIYIQVTAKNINSTGAERTNSFSSSTYTLPLKLNLETPAEVLFYSDSGLTTQITEFSKNQTIYAKLVLRDINGNTISTGNYDLYIHKNSVNFEIVESNDTNIDLATGVTFTEISDYVYSLVLSPNTSFDDEFADIRVTFAAFYE